MIENDFNHFQDLQELASRLGARRLRAGCSRSVEELRAAQEVAQRGRRHDYVERQLLSRGGWQTQERAPPKPCASHPRRARSALGTTAARGTTDSAAEAEAQARHKYLEELVDLLLALGAPVVEEVAKSEDVRAALRLAAGGRRARTLRTRLRAWRSFSRWLYVARCRHFPREWLEVIDYARVRSAGPCGRQTLPGLFWAVSFIERAGNYGAHQCITRSTLYQSACREVLATVTARAGGEGPAPALRPLTSVMAMLELVIVSDAAPRWLGPSPTGRC